MFSSALRWVFKKTDTCVFVNNRRNRPRKQIQSDGSKAEGLYQVQVAHCIFTAIFLNSTETMPQNNLIKLPTEFLNPPLFVQIVHGLFLQFLEFLRLGWALLTASRLCSGFFSHSLACSIAFYALSTPGSIGFPSDFNTFIVQIH